MYMRITEPFQGINQNRWLDLSHSNETHHGMRCISSSQLKHLASGKSMESFYNKFILKNVPSVFNDAFRVGTIAHLAVLEPEKFENSVLVCDLDQRTNEFKDFRLSMARPVQEVQESVESVLLNCTITKLEQELAEASTKEQEKVIKSKIKKAKDELKLLSKSEAKDEFKIQFTKDGAFLNHEGQEIFLVKTEEMAMYRTFQNKFEQHKRLNVMIPDCVVEQSGIAQDPETGLWMSLRGDARSERGFFIDPKTMTEELSSTAIERYCSSFHLHIQAVHYLETANLIEPHTYKKFFFVMMSKVPNYEIALVTLDEQAMEFGKKVRRTLLNKIADCEASGKWPAVDFNEGLHGLKISLPAWSYK